MPIIPATVPRIPSDSQLNKSSDISDSWKKHLRQGTFLCLNLKVKTCPANLLIAPTIRIFLNLRQQAFNKNFVIKLSDPSTM